MESDDESSFRRWWMNKQKTIFMQFKNMNQTNEKSYKYISGATNLQESVQAQESYVVPHHLHPPTGDLHHHDLLRGPIPIPLLQYLGRWPEKLLLNINLMILLPQIHYRLISNISLFVPHRQPYLLCRCHCHVKGTTWGTSCPSCKKWKSIIFRRTSKQATEDAWGNKNYPGSIS